MTLNGGIMEENEEYFLKKIVTNEARIKELEAQNAKYQKYVSTGKFPKKNGKKPVKKPEIITKKEEKSEKGYFGI